MMYLKRGPGDPPVGFGLRNMRLRTGLSVISMHDGARTPLSFFPVNFSSSSSSSSSRIGLRKTAVGWIQTPTAVRTTNRRWMVGYACLDRYIRRSSPLDGRNQQIT